MAKILLPIADRDALAECEQIIERGLTTFVEVGQALTRVRNEKLYRAEYATFEGYLDERWHMSRPHAYRLIEAANIVSPIGDKLPGLPLPTTESQARALAKVPEEHRAEVWQQVTDTTGTPTAKAVTEAAARFVPPPPAMSPEAAEERRRKRVVTDLITDLISSLSLLADSTELDYYTPDMASPNPINDRTITRAAEAVQNIRAMLTRRGLL